MLADIQLQISSFHFKKFKEDHLAGKVLNLKFSMRTEWLRLRNCIDHQTPKHYGNDVGQLWRNVWSLRNKD